MNSTLTDSAGSSADDNRVSIALEEYLAAMEGGDPLTREELLTKYADVATELAGCLESLDFIHQAAPQVVTARKRFVGSAVLCDGTAGTHPRVALGDYQIIRELGRGGMGVVYEAEQLSLGRRVALKVLPFASMLDERQKKRFRNEARAAASLDHPNIVSVLGTGEERGVHYFAMQLISGHNLAEVIAELRRLDGSKPSICSPHSVTRIANELSQQADAVPKRSPAEPGASTNPSTIMQSPSALMKSSNHTSSKRTREYFRSVAEIGLQAARALDHAHINGVVHRDIKPANIMLDSECRAYISDFGLAHVESGLGVTMTGDVIGTLRYMSPEQGSGNRGVIDHRSDIYSLGVTLYELLTLQPAIEGEDREELIRNLAAERQPSPRRLVPELPVDLETIVLKACAKDPNDRYETAIELADDIQRFLRHEPIRAKRSTLAERSVKWVRRHPSAVISISAASLVAAAGVAVASAVVMKKSNDAIDALNRMQVSNLVAKERHQEAEYERELSESWRQVTKASLAENLRNAPALVRESNDLNRVPERDRRSLIESVLTHNQIIQRLESLAERYPQRSQIAEDLSMVHASVAVFMALLGEYDHAIAELHRSRNLAASPDEVLAELDGENGVAATLLALLYAKSGSARALSYCHALGMTEGPDGSLFLGSRNLNSVLRFDPDTGRCSVFAQGGGLVSPNQLVFGPDSHLYVCSEYSNQVLRYDGASGEFMDVFVSDIDHPVGLVFAPDGSLLVSSFTHHQIVRFDGATGRRINVLVHSQGAGERYPTQIAFDSEGLLYVAWQFSDAVLRYDGESGSLIDEFVSQSNLNPASICFGPHGNLYVSSGVDMGGGAVKAFSGTTGEPKWEAGEGSSSGVAVDSHGNVYVSFHGDRGVEWSGPELGEVLRSLTAGYGRPEDALANSIERLRLVSQHRRGDWKFHHDYALRILKESSLHESVRLASYRTLCREMLKGDHAEIDSRSAWFASWVCVLGPAAVDDYEPVVELAKRAADSRFESDGLAALGCVFYRAGRFGEAREYLQEAAGQNEYDLGTAPFTNFFLAMSCSRLGRKQEAKDWHARALAESNRMEWAELWWRKSALELVREEAAFVIARADVAK